MTIPHDKIDHIFMGITTAAMLAPFGLVPAIVGTTVVAIGKEIWDKMGHGTPEVMDALAVEFGGALLLSWYALLGVTL